MDSQSGVLESHSAGDQGKGKEKSPAPGSGLIVLVIITVKHLWEKQNNISHWAVIKNGL